VTAQSPERIILDGRPRCLYADPLYRLRQRCRMDFGNPNLRSTANYRGYVGTWEIRDRRLYLVQLCWEEWTGPNGEVPVSEELRLRLFRAAQCNGFPIHAHWFNGVMRIELGRRLVYSHQGWSHWFERERVMRFRAGELVRDREVDTRAILEWWLLRHPEELLRIAGPRDAPLRPLIWFDTDDDEDEEADWWPPDFAVPARQTSAISSEADAGSHIDLESIDRHRSR
jgi:hypothetical protein